MNDCIVPYAVTRQTDLSFSLMTSWMFHTSAKPRQCLLFIKAGIVFFRCRSSEVNSEGLVRFSNLHTLVAWSHGDKLGYCNSNSFSKAAQELESDNATITLDIAPNPVSTSTLFSFLLVEAGAYKLELFDVNGVKIRHIKEAVAAKGQRMNYTFDARGLRRGIYLLRLTANNSIVLKKLIIQ